MTQTNNPHTKQRHAQSPTVKPPHRIGNMLYAPLLIVLPEIMLVCVATVVRDDELREGGGGEDVGHDEGEVHGCPEGGGAPVPADGVDV